MSVIISGATGLLGRSVFNVLKRSLPDKKVVGLGFTRCADGIVKCDLTSESEVLGLFQNLNPRIFVHAAAERRPDIVESGGSRAMDINIKATKLLARKCHDFHCTLVFISTDYVFDGTSPPYDELCSPNPLNSYGLQKAEGEKVVLSANSSNLVLRVPILYGPLDSSVGLDESAVTTLFKAVKNANSHSKMDDVAVRYPTLTTDVANVILNIVTKLTESTCNLSGIFHATSSEPYTKYQMVLCMANLFSLPSSHIVADKESAFHANTKRPLNSKLSSNRLEQFGIITKMTPFPEGVKPCLVPFT